MGGGTFLGTGEGLYPEFFFIRILLSNDIVLKLFKEEITSNWLITQKHC